jgi:hypothetical protein
MILAEQKKIAHDKHDKKVHTTMGKESAMTHGKHDGKKGTQQEPPARKETIPKKKNTDRLDRGKNTDMLRDMFKEKTKMLTGYVQTSKKPWLLQRFTKGCHYIHDIKAVCSKGL